MLGDELILGLSEGVLLIEAPNDRVAVGDKLTVFELVLVAVGLIVLVFDMETDRLADREEVADGLVEGVFEGVTLDEGVFEKEIVGDRVGDEVTETKG